MNDQKREVRKNEDIQNTSSVLKISIDKQHHWITVAPTLNFWAHFSRTLGVLCCYAAPEIHMRELLLFSCTNQEIGTERLCALLLVTQQVAGTEFVFRQLEFTIEH